MDSLIGFSEWILCVILWAGPRPAPTRVGTDPWPAQGQKENIANGPRRTRCAESLVDSITEALADELLDFGVAAVARLGTRRRHPSSSSTSRKTARRDEHN